MLSYNPSETKYSQSIHQVVNYNAKVMHEIIDSATTQQEWKFIRDFWNYLVENQVFDEHDVQKIRSTHNIRWCFHHTLLKLIEKGMDTWVLINDPTSP
jgi:hypothetical protein